MAVFGMILSRHAVKSVQTLQNMFKKCTGSAEEVIDVVIAAITLIRAFDVARRRYNLTSSLYYVGIFSVYEQHVLLNSFSLLSTNELNVSRYNIAVTETYFSTIKQSS